MKTPIIPVRELNVIRRRFVDLLNIVSPRDFAVMTEVVAKLKAMSNPSLEKWTLAVRFTEKGDDLWNLLATTDTWADPANPKLYDLKSHELVTTLAETVKEYKADDTVR